MTLLGMELHGKDISACNRASKRRWIVDAAGSQRAVVRHRVVAVCEVEAGCVGDTLPQRMRPPLTNRAPAHVRNLEPGAVRVDHRRVGKAFDAAMQQAKAGSGPFLALVEEHLQAKADAEKRPVANNLEHDVPQAALVQAAHAIGHRALPGKDHTRCAPDCVRDRALTTMVRSGATCLSAFATERRFPMP